ncbi:oxidoreductase, partial [mine drainage metagenome]
MVPPKLNPVRVPIPETPPAERVRDFGEILQPYRLEDAVLEAKRCIQCRRPWCVEACPINQDCREYIKLVAEEKFDEAARVTLREDSPRHHPLQGLLPLLRGRLRGEEE